VGAREDFHQRAFARAVFTHQGEHLAAVHFQIDARERDGRAEPLSHPFHPQSRRRGHGHLSTPTIIARNDHYIPSSVLISGVLKFSIVIRCTPVSIICSTLSP